jgi:23S rRNA maturation mini-RNase III
MADTVFEPFIARKIVRILDDSFSLTSKGTAFVDFVKARGFVLDSFNDEHFTEHESEWERAARNHLLSKPLDDA